MVRIDLLIQFCLSQCEEKPTPAPTPRPTFKKTPQPTPAPTMMCGNGKVDPGEECDISNGTPYGGCRKTFPGKDKLECNDVCECIGCGNNRLDYGEECETDSDCPYPSTQYCNWCKVSSFVFQF